MGKINTLIAALRVRAAKKKADRLHDAFGCKYYVIQLNGALKVVPKQTIKQLLKEHRFKPGTKVQDIEACAIYITR